MTNIILDTNIIIAYPKILGIKIENVHFLVPIDVIFELNNRANKRGKPYDDRVVLIERSAEQGTISIINTNLPSFRNYQKLIDYEKLGQTDVNILSTALVYLDKHENIKIATLDKDLKAAAASNDIEILENTEIEEIISNFEDPTSRLNTKERINELLIFTINIFLSSLPIIGGLLKIEKLELPSIQGKIVFFEQKEKTNLFAGILIGVSATALAIFIYKNLSSITSTINVWGSISLTIFSGILLFIFRERERLSYGLFEFLIGVASIIIVFQSNNFDFEHMNFNIDLNIKLIGGLYIMVRGQDNIVKSLKDTKIGIQLKKYGIGS